MNQEALVVGINRYPFLKKQKPGDSNLEAAVKDAEAIAEMLEKYSKFHVQRLPTGYDEENKERFIPDGKVKVNDLEQQIINLFNPPGKNEVPEVALFFFAGHGYLKETGEIQEGFLVTSDANFKNNRYGISLTWLKELLKKSPVKKQIVWLDCCFSGELLNFDQEADPGIQGKQISRCFITASRSFETAKEQLNREQGIFTANLLAALNPENYVDGWVTNYKLAEFIEKKMYQTSQKPMFHNSGDAIILTTNTPSQPTDDRWKNTPPYRALSYFNEKEEDAVFFHGRNRLTDELIDRVRTNNFVAVLGASGSGKSSLLRAGLLYQLKRGQKISGSDRWQYIQPFTPTSSPLENLQQAINIESEKPENLTEKLIEFINQAEAERVIMVIDQFEESFTLCENPEKRQEFFDCFLAALANKATQNKFCLILGMRADFLDQCSIYSGLATQIKEHQLLVTPLEKQEIEEAITKPAELVGMQVQPELVTNMTRDFLDNPGSLPLLQYTLDVLWQSATQGKDKSKYLTQKTYQNLGGIKGTLTRRADEVYGSLNDLERSIAKRIFLELVQPGEQTVNPGKITDTRRRVILEKLPNDKHSLELLNQVSNKLADPKNRLITKNNSEEGTVLDVIHEELIRSWETLRKWVEEYQEALPLERRIEADADKWKNQDKKEDLLYRAGNLSEAEKYLEEYDEMYLLDGVAYEFIQASQDLKKRLEKEKEEQKKREFEQEQKARRLAQRRNQILGTSLVIMTGISAYAWIQQVIAKHNSEVSFARQLGAEAEVISSYQEYDKSVLLAVESMKRVTIFKKWREEEWGKVVKKFLGSQFPDIPQKAADKPIRNGLAKIPDHLHTLNHQGYVLAVAFSPDGKTIATASNDKTARLWEADTGKELASLLHQGTVNAVAFSPNGKTIATASDDKTARLWEADTGKELATLLHQETVWEVAFSPDGKTIATASSDKTARLWEADTGKELATLLHQFPVNAVAFSPDGKTIATASDDKTARLWEADTGKELASLLHQDIVTAVAFSPDGKTIATASYDNTARLHLATPEGLIAEACRRLSRNFTAEEWEQYMNSGLEKYKKTCDQLPVHRSLVAAAKNLAAKGEKEDIKTAISIFKRAQELEPKIDLDPDTKDIEKDPKIVAKKFAASAKVAEGKNLAREGKINEAISLFKEAQKWDSEIDLDPDTETRETDPEIVAKKLAASAKVAEGKNLAREGKINEAISLFKEAQKWDSEIDLDADTETRETDPEIVAKKLAATSKIEEGKKLAKEGKIEEAISLYEEAQKLDSDVEIAAEDWNTLCRFGSLNNQAKDVMFACEKAVKLSPESDAILDIRGLARALTGDYQGAVEDFQVFVNSTKNKKKKAQRQGWIEVLKKGENPITEEVLKELKN